MRVLGKDLQGNLAEIQGKMRRSEQVHKDLMIMRRVWHMTREAIHHPGPSKWGDTLST